MNNYLTHAWAAALAMVSFLAVAEVNANPGNLYEAGSVELVYESQTYYSVDQGDYSWIQQQPTKVTLGGDYIDIVELGTLNLDTPIHFQNLDVYVTMEIGVYGNPDCEPHEVHRPSISVEFAGAASGQFGMTTASLCVSQLQFQAMPVMAAQAIKNAISGGQLSDLRGRFFVLSDEDLAENMPASVPYICPTANGIITTVAAMRPSASAADTMVWNAVDGAEAQGCEFSSDDINKLNSFISSVGS